MVILLANHKVFFFNLLKEHIKGTYGFPRQDEEEYQQRYREGILTDQEVQDHNCPGPFSYHTYLTALLEPTMWGDEQVLCLCSMMWQIGLTVVSAEKFTQVKFRHKAALPKVDAVLVMCLGQHYVPTHKYLQLLHLDRCILQLDGCTLHPDESFLCPDSCFVFLSYCAWTDIYCTGWVHVVLRWVHNATGQVYKLLSVLSPFSTFFQFMVWMGLMHRDMSPLLHTAWNLTLLPWCKAMMP